MQVSTGDMQGSSVVSDGGSSRSNAGARPAAHGVVLLTSAQALMVVFGYVIHIAAARLLDSPADYGRFVVVLSIMTWVKYSQVLLVLPGLRKIVSEDHRRFRPALIAAGKWYSLIALAFLFGFRACVPLLAGVLADPILIPFLALAALEMPFFAALAMCRQLLTAIRRYAAEGVPMMVYSVTRAGAVCLLLALGYGVMGAIIGQIIGTGVAVAITLVLCLRVQAQIPAVPYPPMMRRAFGWTAMEFPAALGIMTLASLDLWLVQRLIEDEGLIGVYGAAFTLSRLPHFFVAGMTAAVFPRVSGAFAEGNRELAREVGRKAIRLLIVVFIPFCCLMGSSADEIVGLLFPAKFGGAGGPVVLLSIAMSCLGVTLLLCSLVAAANRPGARLALVAVLLPLGYLLICKLIPVWGLSGAAAASLVTTAVGVTLASLFVGRSLGILPPGLTILRCALAGAAVYLLGRIWPTEGLMVMVKCVAVGVFYVAGLVLLRELRKEDLTSLTCVFSRKSSAGTQTSVTETE